MIKGLIFDLDGTLVNTKEANYLSYHKAFKSIGVDLSRSKYYEAFGLRFDDMVKKICPNLDPVSTKTLKESKALYYKDNLRFTTLNPLLISVIRNNKFSKIALATTASKKNALEVLKYYSLVNTFDECIFGEDVSIGKPDPECYNLAIKSLNLMPSECLIFEDTLIGVSAGRRSGANVINVEGWFS